jgi:hypothetical protein
MATIKAIQRKKGTAYQIGYTLHGIRFSIFPGNILDSFGEYICKEAL